MYFFLCFFKSGEEGCHALNIKYGGFVKPDIRFVSIDVLILKYIFLFANQARKDAMLSKTNMEHS